MGRGSSTCTETNQFSTRNNNHVWTYSVIGPADSDFAELVRSKAAKWSDLDVRVQTSPIPKKSVFSMQRYESHHTINAEGSQSHVEAFAKAVDSAVAERNFKPASFDSIQEDPAY